MSFEERILGRWKLERAENLDEYMKANNVNFMLRQVAKALSVTLEVTKEGDVWTFHYMSTFKNVKLVYKLGEPFEETTVDGRKMTSCYTMEDGNMVCDQQPTNPSRDRPSKFIFNISEDDILAQHFICNNSNNEKVEGVRYFKRIAST